MSVQLVIDNDQPIPPVDLYAHWQDEPHWHESQQAEAHGWARLWAMLFAAFFAGCLFTAALAFAIDHLTAASDRNAPRSAQHIATVDAGSDKGIPS